MLKKLSKEIVEDILNCGRLAPSAKNRQPWYFVVVEDDIKNKIAGMMLSDNIIDEVNLKAKTGSYVSSVKPTADTIKQAPILVLIFKEKDDNWLVSDNLSIGACLENMCLRATELGIGSLWIRDTITYTSKKIAKMVNHEELELSCALTLGYANKSPKVRPRKELKDIVEWYHF